MPAFDKYISELLYEHDCVIVPNFGGFVGNKVSAEYQKSTHHFKPPFKQVSFNQNLQRNDGLLISYLAEKENKTYQQAEGEIIGFAKTTKSKLEQEKEVVIEKVGTLYYDRNKKLRFQQDYSVNYLKEAFGLSALQLVPIDTREEEITNTKLSAAKKVIPIAATKKQKNKRKVALLYAAAVLPIIAYLCWLPLKTDLLKPNGNFHYSDLNPFTEKICPLYSQRISANTTAKIMGNEETTSWMLSEKELVEVSFIDRENTTPIIVRLKEKPEVAESTFVEPTKPALKLRYHLVGGCFSKLGNAKRLVKKLNKKGYKSHIIDNHKGLNRVSVESYASREEAIEQLKEIRSQVNGNTWLLVK